MTDVKKCSSCRYWSEMLAEVRDGQVMAYCLSSDGERAGKYTSKKNSCPSWASGHYGAIDCPPGYGEVSRALYADEDVLAQLES